MRSGSSADSPRKYPYSNATTTTNNGKAVISNVRVGVAPVPGKPGYVSLGKNSPLATKAPRPINLPSRKMEHSSSIVTDNSNDQSFRDVSAVDYDDSNNICHTSTTTQRFVPKNETESVSSSMEGSPRHQHHASESPITQFVNLDVSPSRSTSMDTLSSQCKAWRSLPVEYPDRSSPSVLPNSYEAPYRRQGGVRPGSGLGAPPIVSSERDFPSLSSKIASTSSVVMEDKGRQHSRSFEKETETTEVIPKPLFQPQGADWGLSDEDDEMNFEEPIVFDKPKNNDETHVKHNTTDASSFFEMVDNIEKNENVNNKDSNTISQPLQVKTSTNAVPASSPKLTQVSHTGTVPPLVTPSKRVVSTEVQKPKSWADASSDESESENSRMPVPLSSLTSSVNSKSNLHLNDSYGLGRTHENSVSKSPSSLNNATSSAIQRAKEHELADRNANAEYLHRLETISSSMKSAAEKARERRTLEEEELERKKKESAARKLKELDDRLFEKREAERLQREAEEKQRKIVMDAEREKMAIERESRRNRDERDHILEKQKLQRLGSQNAKDKNDALRLVEMDKTGQPFSGGFLQDSGSRNFSNRGGFGSNSGWNSPPTGSSSYRGESRFITSHVPNVSKTSLAHEPAKVTMLRRPGEASPTFGSSVPISLTQSDSLLAPVKDDKTLQSKSVTSHGSELGSSFNKAPTIGTLRTDERPHHLMVGSPETLATSLVMTNSTARQPGSCVDEKISDNITSIESEFVEGPDGRTVFRGGGRARGRRLATGVLHNDLIPASSDVSDIYTETSNIPLSTRTRKVASNSVESPAPQISGQQPLMQRQNQYRGRQNHKGGSEQFRIQVQSSLDGPGRYVTVRTDVADTSNANPSLTTSGNGQQGGQPVHRGASSGGRHPRGSQRGDVRPPFPPKHDVSIDSAKDLQTVTLNIDSISLAKNKIEKKKDVPDPNQEKSHKKRRRNNKGGSKRGGIVAQSPTVHSTSHNVDGNVMLHCADGGQGGGI